jgi:filamin
VFNNDKHLTYSCSYVPSLEGRYSVVVKFAGRDIPKSPFTVQVEQLPADASKVTVSGPGVDATALLMAKRDTHFDVNTAGKLINYCQCLLARLFA